MNKNQELSLVKNQLTLNRYAFSTHRTYVAALQQFFDWLFNREYNYQLAASYLVEKNFNRSKQNQVVNAIKFWREKCHGEDRIIFQSLRPKATYYKPAILSLEEVARIILATSNLKHKAMLACTYFGALRNAEMRALKVSDIDSQRMQIHVQAGKGQKDRFVSISAELIEILRAYYKKYRPNNYLFEGQYGDNYSGSSLRKVFLHACNAAAIYKQCTIHTLRHSRATHWIENGNDIQFVQAQLGHSDIRTTLRYVYQAKVSIEHPALFA